MTSGEKDIFRVALLGTVEAYLSCFYQLKYGSDLNNEITNDPSFVVSGSIGLGTQISYLVKKGVFPSSYVTYPKASLELAIIKATNVVKKARNDVTGHPKVKVILADNIMSAQIHDTLLLFLYLASKL